MNQFRHPRLSVKLGLVVLAIVAGALGIVYAAVVPRLEDRLVDDRLDALTASAPSVAGKMKGADPLELRRAGGEHPGGHRRARRRHQLARERHVRAGR